jgi:N-acetyl-beta-hexosaminidase
MAPIGQIAEKKSAIVCSDYQCLFIVSSLSMTKMTVLSLVLLAIAHCLPAQTPCPVIPLPASATKQSGVFTCNANTTIITSQDSLHPVAQYLQQELQKIKGVTVKTGRSAKGATIRLVTQPGKNAEGYSLMMKPGAVTITGHSAAGVFYGVISLLQIAAQSSNATIPCWSINDSPTFTWRGYMLDESRYFFGKEKVKQILDQMAFYKLNKFHWHLTDQPGWRIEIKKYPKLTEIGGRGNHFDSTAAPAYYTQEEIKEIVAYAAERFITVVPEIDMPGHATAANRAYPEFSGGGSARYPEFTFNPGYEGTYQYLADILKETDALFPSQMIHLGGDEVSFGNEKWLSNPHIQNLMRTHNLKDAKAVEFYFIRRMADTLTAMNNKTLAWDEVAQADLAPQQTIVFWWRHDQPKQLATSLQKGYSVVLCPRLPFYFDFVQDSAHVSGRKWGKEKLFNPLQRVYNFSLADYNLPAEQKPQVLGIQANVWTETIKTSQRLDFMMYPRLCAFAEAAWTKPAQKNYDEFTRRLQGHLPLLKKQGIHYYEPSQPEPIH